MIYETQYIKNLFTGRPFSLEISAEQLSHFELQKKMVRDGNAPMLGSIEKLTRVVELSFFPSFHELLKIWIENGYTDELMSQILRDFEIPDDFAQKLLEDEKFVAGLKGWFEGITCDGERAAATLGLVYNAVADYFSVKQPLPI